MKPRPSANSTAWALAVQKYGTEYADLFDWKIQNGKLIGMRQDGSTAIITTAR